MLADQKDWQCQQQKVPWQGPLKDRTDKWQGRVAKSVGKLAKVLTNNKKTKPGIELSFEKESDGPGNAE